MSGKAKLFRSLLLEPLECRAVFSADSFEVWQFSHPTRNDHYDHFQPAQYPLSESVRFSFGSQSDDDGPLRESDNARSFRSVIVIERWSTRGSMRRDRFGDKGDLPLPPPEGESHPFDTRPAPPTSNVAPQKDTQPTRTQPTHTQPTQQNVEPKIVNVFDQTHVSSGFLNKPTLPPCSLPEQLWIWVVPVERAICPPASPGEVTLKI